jgi:hypothetical protein
MKTLFATTILLGSLAFPAFAQMADDMSCADFMAMDSSGQMEAMKSMGGMIEGDAMMSEGDDAAKSEDMASDQMEVTAKTVAQSCEGHDDMMVTEIFEQAKMAK